MKSGLLLGLLLTASFSAHATSFKLGEYAKKESSCKAICSKGVSSCESLLNGYINIVQVESSAIITPGLVDNRERKSKFTYLTGTHTRTFSEGLAPVQQEYTLSEGLLVLKNNSALETSIVQIKSLENGNLLVTQSVLDKTNKQVTNTACSFEKF